MEPGDNVRDIVFLDLRTLIVQAVPVSLHIIEPDIFCTAGIGLGENQNGRRYSRIGLEHTGWHGNHSLQLLIFYQLMADCPMSLG